MRDSKWVCVAVAPSYDDFCNLSLGTPIPWSQTKGRGAPPNIQTLLIAANKLANANVDLVSVDMPLSNVPITTRRTADQLISTHFAAMGCATHSPNSTRPGLLGQKFINDLNSSGYQLATTTTTVGQLQRTIEVYPHPALLTLLGARFRVPYKINKSNTYWENQQISIRINNLLVEFRKIESALSNVFGPTNIPIPAFATNLSPLKKYEDSLDALICAWVGVMYINKHATPYGNTTAAIWCP